MCLKVSLEKCQKTFASLCRVVEFAKDLHGFTFKGFARNSQIFFCLNEIENVLVVIVKRGNLKPRVYRKILKKPIENLDQLKKEVTGLGISI